MDGDIVIKLEMFQTLYSSVNGSDTAKERGGYLRFIKPLEAFIEKKTIQEIIDAWAEYQYIWEGKNDFVENVCVNVIYHNMLRDNLLSDSWQIVQNLIIEIMSIQFTSFIKWFSNDKTISDSELINIVCYYARIIEHNKKGMADYIELWESEQWYNKGRIFILLR